MWFILALLSAIFAALTSILAKIGIDGVNSNLAIKLSLAIAALLLALIIEITSSILSQAIFKPCNT